MASGAGLESFTLPAALVELEAAATLLTPEDPAELRAELAQLTARVYYDIGGAAELETACGLLVGARRDLLDAGRPLEAARMLNDEATVRVRRGELARAAELLNRAREMFVRFADASPVAQREVAQTEHLVARLVLHAPEEQRRDREALRFALERAHAAERGYAQIGDQRERARAWETLARIERLLDERDTAMQHLQSAVQVQSRLGDAVGMARTTAALAELMADTGRFEDAVGLLDESVALNVSKGSVSGLAYNRRGLDELITRMPPRERDVVGSALDHLRSRIESASPEPGRQRALQG
jgi:tetratricopeptide (TPR) repeat protein